MRSMAAAASGYTCHVNIGRRVLSCPSALSPAKALNQRRISVIAAARGGRSSPLIEFFDDLTRGSVSSFEEEPDDVTKPSSEPPAADAAAAAAAATAADARAAAADKAAGVTAAVEEFQQVATAAVVAATTPAAGDAAATGTPSVTKAEESVRSLETLAAVAAQDLSIAATTDSSTTTPTAAGSRGSSSSQATPAPQGVRPASGNSGDSSSSSSSRQAVTDEAVRAAGGELQASALSLTAVQGGDATVAAGQVAGWVLKGLVGLGVLQLFKSGVEALLQQLGIVTIPAAVVSMCGVPLLLSVLRPKLADQLVGFYDTTLAPWTTDLLGLFYIPVVAILPVLLRGMQAADLRGLLSVATVATTLTLLLSAKAANTLFPTGNQNSSHTPAAKATATGGQQYKLASGPAATLLLSLSFLAAAGPLALTKFDPLRFGAAMALPVGFAWSLLGFFAGAVCLQQQRGNGGKSAAAAGDAGWMSPLLLGAVAANVGVAWHGRIMGWDYLGSLARYYAGDVLGAGEVLVAPLGAALTALGLCIYKHRAALHLPTIAAACLVSAATSVITAVGAARLLGVSADWARALIPRSVTGSTASHLAASLGAPTECAGLVVLLQAAITVAIGQGLFKAVYGRDKLHPGAAGAAAGATAGVMGAVGACGGDGVALAHGALAYACMVLLPSVASGVPALTAALAAVVA